jgi:hypothetical protein
MIVTNLGEGSARILGAGQLLSQVHQELWTN